MRNYLRESLELTGCNGILEIRQIESVFTWREKSVHFYEL